MTELKFGVWSRQSSRDLLRERNLASKEAHGFINTDVFLSHTRSQHLNKTNKTNEWDSDYALIDMKEYVISSDEQLASKWHQFASNTNPRSSFHSHRINIEKEGSTTGEDTGSGSDEGIIPLLNVSSSSSSSSKFKSKSTTELHEVIVEYENHDAPVLCRSFSDFFQHNDDQFVDSLTTYTSVELTVGSVRLCREYLFNFFHREFAQFNVSFKVQRDSEPSIVWRRHSGKFYHLKSCRTYYCIRNFFYSSFHFIYSLINLDFNILLQEIIKLNETETCDLSITLQSWEDMLRAKPSFRMLNIEYLKSKQLYIEEFLRNLLSELDSPTLFLNFCDDEWIESKKKESNNHESWIQKLIYSLKTCCD